MIVVELAFDTEPPHPARLAARPAHRRRLLQLHARGLLVTAGPWQDDSGALLVFRTDRPGLDEIMSTDPYYATPGVAVTAVRQWRPIVGVQFVGG